MARVEEAGAWYQQYLRSSGGRRTTIIAKSRAGNRCERCGFRGLPTDLEVQPRPGSYARLGQELPEDLEVLCRTCYGRIEAPRSRDDRLIPRSQAWWREQYAIRDRKLEKMDFESHPDYLANPGYQARKRPVFHRAAGWCAGCLQQSRVEVHHLHYETLGAETPDDLIALCRDCHEVAHNRAPLPALPSDYRSKLCEELGIPHDGVPF